MDSLPLWNDTLESALTDVLRGIYGRGWQKKAAAEMFPTEDPIAKGDWLDKALDPQRPEKLALCDLIWILKRGREYGLHAAMFFLADECDYTRPTPIDPADKRAEQEREFNQSVTKLLQLAQRMGAK